MEINTIKKVGAWLGALILMVNASVASAVVLTFEGLQDLEYVDDFYNGGTGSLGSIGPDYDVVFGDAAAVFIDSDAGGTGNFANEPSSDTALNFNPYTGNTTMNVLSGFATGFSFYYSAGLAGTVTIYDALDATGNILGTISLTANYDGNNCTGDPTGNYCNWDPIGVAFAGTAYSVSFAGSRDSIFFDNLTIGSETPGSVPAPATLALLSLGIAGIGYQRHKQIKAL